MKNKILILSLLLISSSGFASVMPGNLIACEPKTVIFDAGFFMDISQAGSGIQYVFSQDSYSGRQIKRERPVSIGSLKSASSCKLTIYTNDENSAPQPMFYIVKSNSSNQWELRGAGNNSVPDLKCEVSAQLENDKCESAEEFTPIGIKP